MDDKQTKLVGQCLRASAYGPFFKDEHAEDPHWEILSLFGLSIDELRDISDRWPNVDLQNEKVTLAISNSLGNLAGYPHSCSKEVWAQHISVTADEIMVLRNELGL